MRMPNLPCRPFYNNLKWHAFMKVISLPPLHAANLVANIYNNVFGVESIKWIEMQLKYNLHSPGHLITWWRHQMKAFSALLTLCEGNPPITCGFPSQRPVTRSFDVFFDLCLNKRLSQSGRRWFETPPRSLWRHCNDQEAQMCYWVISKRPLLDPLINEGNHWSIHAPWGTLCWRPFSLV